MAVKMVLELVPAVLSKPKGSIFAAFIDYCKVFGGVNRGILLCKLKEILGEDDQNLGLLQSMMEYNKIKIPRRRSWHCRPIQHIRNRPRTPTQSGEQRTILLMNKFLLPEDVAENLRLHDSRPPRFHGLSKFHKAGVSLRSIISTNRSPSYRQIKYLASLLGPLSNSTYHGAEFIGFSSTLWAFFGSNQTTSSSALTPSLSHDGTEWRFLEVFESAVWWRYHHAVPPGPHFFILLFQRRVLRTDGSPLLPVIASFIVEDFEEVALSRRAN